MTSNPPQKSEHEMWDELNINYELAYQHNPLKLACISAAIEILKPGSSVLDLGCGTGIPVSQQLAEAGMQVTGIDVAPSMVELARRRIAGTFTATNMIDYLPPQQSFDGIFIIFSQLGLSYAEFYDTTRNCLQALRDDGILVIGQCASDEHVQEHDEAYDETHSYVQGFNLPFYGEPFATLMFSRKGLSGFLRSAGLEIVYDEADWFKPQHPKCDPEFQQYVIARRIVGQALSAPTPLPRRSDSSPHSEL
ncbi:S-adenosyl-L-methionine-dependent methyltransferase [Xylariales sp. PMI_506]|nr:S-adenosyl-L-methionine-dependent methyltransferase [Xylariales sp. PMI_506]